MNHLEDWALQNAFIADKEIPSADPAAVLEQYKAWIHRIAKKYYGLVNNSGAYDAEDLYQAGCLGLIKAQKTYNPESGLKFLTWSYNPIAQAMLEQLGYREPGRRIPPAMIMSLDATLGEDEEYTIADTVADPNIRPFDEPICEEETRQEIAAEVRSAVDRMKSDRQREVIQRVYLDEQERAAAAEDMGISISALRSLDAEGRRNLRRDKQLSNYAFPFFHVGVKAFNSSWTSAVEQAVIWREEHLTKRSESE